MKSLEDVRAQLLRLADNPAEAVRSAADLAELVGDLEPPDLGLSARPRFERGSSWSYPCVFENVKPGQTPVSQRVLCSSGDVWVRGLVATCYPSIILDSIGSLSSQMILAHALAETMGPDWRGLLELEYKIDGDAGFISDGLGDEMIDGRLSTGDGMWYVPLDWILQRDQTIQVSVNARTQAMALGTSTDNDLKLIDDLRYVTVVFWGERIKR